MQKKVKIVLVRVLDPVLAILLFPISFIMLFYRRTGSEKLPLSSWLLKRVGVFIIRRHYTEPAFDFGPSSPHRGEPRDLPGLDFRVSDQLTLLKALTFTNEIFNLEKFEDHDSDLNFDWKNRSFESGDAEFLYQLIRFVKPKKIVEIGSGNSTKLAISALAMNRQIDRIASEHICIEPYLAPWLEKRSEVTVLRDRVEDLAINWTEELSSGDLLFIDSSHMIRSGGDVLHEYLQILPTLAKGVYVHIHDIFSPRDYPEKWLQEEVRFWNEQYLVEALLMNSSRYKVIAALNLLANDYFSELKKVCPHLTTDRQPGSLYLQVI